MRKFLAISLALILLPSVLHAANKRPFMILFPVIAGEGASTEVGTETTQAIKTYIRQTGKADVADFDPESSLVIRALQENRIQSSDLVGSLTPDSRMKLGGLIGVPMVVSGDVSIKDDKVNVGMWVGDVQTKQIWKTAVAVVISDGGDRDRATSNALQSAVSTMVWQLVGDVLKNVKPNTSPTDTQQVETPDTKTIEAEPVQAMDKAGAFLGRAEEFEKAGDVANAVQEYRKALNADPKNIDIRLKIAMLYSKRKMYPQAIDELERAQQIAPTNEKVRTTLAQIYEERGTPAKAATVYVSQADKNPTDVNARLSAGDYYSKQNLLEESEKQYKLAVQAAPKSVEPHDRLAQLYASQSRFDDCCTELLQIQKIDTKADQKAIADRYDRYIAFADSKLKSLVDQYNSSSSDFDGHRMTREDYYVKIRQIGLDTEPITRLMEALSAPESSTAAHHHRMIGCSLISQAASHMLRYLETNKSQEMSSANICLSEARKHFSKASGG